MPSPPPPTVAAVVFDVGETLVDETRVWSRWARWMDIPTLTFDAALGATIARGQSHWEVFPMLRPGYSWREDLEHRRAAGEDDCEPDERDLYPDVAPALRELAAVGLRLGVVGNQDRGSEVWLRRLRPALDLIGSSEGWGVEKPDPAFFGRIAEELALPPEHILYVGDRVDNDVVPARAAGMHALHLRRGPWGYIHSALNPAPDYPRIDSLAEVLSQVRALQR